MVSVILPNYNHASFLKQRIDSILNQSYQDFELIILDDCSIDNSITVLETYKNHPKVSHLVFNESNSGSPFKQWGKGLSLATGNYIWIAESDDFAEPTFLEKCVEILEKHHDVGLVYTDSNIIGNGEIVGCFKDKNRIYYPKTDWKEDHLINGFQEIENHLIKNCSIYNVSGVLFKKNAIDEEILNIYNLKYAGDWLCYMLIALKSDIYYISKCLNNYRNHPNNATKISGLDYTGMIERIMVRTAIKKKLKNKSNISKIANKYNLIEFRAIFGGFMRGRINALLFYKVIKLYF